MRTPDEWLTFIGGQLKTKRLRMNMTQDELASRAYISRITVANLERGKGGSLSTFVKILDVLHETAWLERLAPVVDISPKQIHIKGHERQRARK
jgi:transcriptional regulator with XRE-family HTH domain